MSTKHTPGPWSYHRGVDYIHVVAEDGPITGDLRYPCDDDEANHRLIAAAPELLEAVRDALEEFHHPGSARYSRGKDITEVLEAAIAKAEEPTQ